MKYLVFLFFCFFLNLQLIAQELDSKDKIILLSGEVFIGDIYAKTDELVMIKAENGKRFQFLLSQVKSIVEKNQKTSNSTAYSEKTKPEESFTGDFCGDIELSGGISSASNAFSSLPNAEVSMIFGNKNISRKNLFFGLGASYQMLFPKGSSQTINFIPVFIRLQRNFQNIRISPFVGIDAGYSFGLSKGFDGGLFAKTFCGIVRRINYKSDFYGGIFAGVSSISTSLTEIKELKSYQYYGSTAMTTFGFNVGFHF